MLRPLFLTVYWFALRSHLISYMFWSESFSCFRTGLLLFSRIAILALFPSHAVFDDVSHDGMCMCMFSKCALFAHACMLVCACKPTVLHVHVLVFAYLCACPSIYSSCTFLPLCVCMQERLSINTPEDLYKEFTKTASVIGVNNFPDFDDHFNDCAKTYVPLPPRRGQTAEEAEEAAQKRKKGYAQPKKRLRLDQVRHNGPMRLNKHDNSCI